MRKSAGPPLSQNDPNQRGSRLPSPDYVQRDRLKIRVRNAARRAENCVHRVTLPKN